MTTQTPAAARTYLARVRTALADLPDAEIEEIVEDVRPQLVEITEEAGADVRLETLIDRLGSPESYAAELRAAGDYPPPSPPGDEVTAVGPRQPGKGKVRFVFWSVAVGLFAIALFGFVTGQSMHVEVLLGALLAAVIVAFGARYAQKNGGAAVFGVLPEGRFVRDLLRGRYFERGEQVQRYLRSLQPAWWLVCAAVLIGLGLAPVLRGTAWLLIFPLFLASAALVVWSGPRAKVDRRLLWVNVAISALVIGGALGGSAYVLESVDRNASGYDSYVRTGQYSSGSDELFYGNESVENLYAFDAEGEPLNEFYLYDEQGRPVAVPRHGCDPSTGATSNEGNDNQFPRPQVVQGGYDDQGNYNGYNAYRPDCKLVDGVPFTAAIPKPKPQPVPPAESAPPSASTPPAPKPGG